MDNEAKYKAALEKISSLLDDKPGHVEEQENGTWEGVYSWSNSNVDDAYEYGRDAGRWDAKEIADAALNGGAA